MKCSKNNRSNRRRLVGRVAPRAPLGACQTRRTRSDAPYLETAELQVQIA
jgi:hypothetical protein